MKRLCVLTLLVLVPQSGMARDYSNGATPAWVQRVALDAAAVMSAAELSDGVYYLLSDEQVRIEAGDKQVFRHFASRAINDKGLDEVASISIGFDPAYQSLTLHAINVIRAGRVIPKLATAKVRVLQREPELEARIFDGRKSANVFLEDVRVGDIVEYAYSVRGANPVFGGRHFGGLDMGWRVPVARRFGRLLVPHGSPLKLVHHQTPLRPVERDQEAYREYVWDLRNLASIHADGDIPGWYDPYPWVEWSEFGDWGDVARWAEPLYRTPASLSPALQAAVKRLAATSTDPAERMVATLKFVQQEIRYLGVEIGAGSYAPSAPDLVFQRRFGDCKDKALLTVTLLQALGIEAYPALVSTTMLRGIRDLQPSPGAFNHVIVQARIGDRRYWLDPTRAPQSGTIETIVQPDYGQALLVNATTRELSSMEAKLATRVLTKRIVAELNARDGLDKPLRFTVTTLTEGVAAESLRNDLSSHNHEEMQKQYLNYYAHYYPGIEMTAPLEVMDDPHANRVSLIEHYRIKDFWKRSEEEKSFEATGYVPDLDDVLQRPRGTLRTDPLKLAHPVDITVSSVWLMPEEWSLSTENKRIEDAVFSFEHRVSLEDNKRKIVETDHFVSHADFVAGADAPRYAANLEKARQALGITLTKRDAGVEAPATPALSLMDRFNWSIAMLAVTLLAVLAWLALKVYRYDPPPPRGVIDPSLQGIGGWLLLPALGIVVQPLRILKDVAELVPAYAADNWMQLTTVGQTAYHALWGPVLLFELAANLGLLVFSVLLMILFFQRRSSVPRVFLAFQGGALVVGVLDQMAAGLIPAIEHAASGSGWAQVIRQALALAIWGSYFMTSRRVKATFVKTWRAPECAEGQVPSFSLAATDQKTD
jgi:hypothetical protein